MLPNVDSLAYPAPAAENALAIAFQSSTCAHPQHVYYGKSGRTIGQVAIKWAMRYLFLLKIYSHDILL
jgi:hypothetical protein